MKERNRQRSKDRLWGGIPVRIILPVSLTVILFSLTIFLLLLPLIEKKLMDGKREMIRELTESSWSILAAHAQEERDGLLTRQKAQASAIENLRRLRYGPELKDYFWINDMHPRIVMHPYRPDLEGKDISGFSDPNGKRLFVEFVKVVKANSAGYVDYEWQWKDDPDRIVPKISYVKGFEPWGWIVGTGIYVEDVRAEIAAITRKLTLICLGILAVIVALSVYIVRRSVIVEQQKKQAEEKARLRQEQLFRARKSDARIVAATNRNLSRLKETGEFRKDLNYRLRTHRIYIPPLRERLDDIPLLVAHFLAEAARTLGKIKPTPPPELFTLLNTYSFPGNIRELQSMIIDAVSRHKSGVLGLTAFRSHIGRGQPVKIGRVAQSPNTSGESPSIVFAGPELPSIKQATDLLIREAMQRANGNQSIAAGMLGISQQALSKRLKKECVK